MLKKRTQVYLTISLNNVQVERVSHQKHLGILLDHKLNFKQHVDSAISKVSKGISVIKEIRHNTKKIISHNIQNFFETAN